MSILLIRHGQSMAQAGAKTSDPAQIELSELGYEQAEIVTDLLPSTLTKIIVSPFKRAKQTAEPMVNRFRRSVIVEELPVQEFTYIAPTRVHGMDIAERSPFATTYWEKNDPDYIDSNGVESFRQFMARASVTLDTIHPMDALWTADRTAIVTHAMFIRAMMFMVFCGRMVSRDSMRRFRQFCLAVPVPNCSITRLSCDREWSVGAISVNHLPGDKRSE